VIVSPARRSASILPRAANLAHLIPAPALEIGEELVVHRLPFSQAQRLDSVVHVLHQQASYRINNRDRDGHERLLSQFDIERKCDIIDSMPDDNHGCADEALGCLIWIIAIGLAVKVLGWIF
jgi:hypothetical protein